ncbi:flagellar rod assembly protein FlgJ [Sulfuricella sp. T08]|uniref:flagellar assembly peptidoglycan hydrolase FlgJ n=1 Tax=Sulfuricella sp. T08 TaxID=1632857 RepID=UPI0006179F5C|nr:flagellar assembly peptidoglycan hydrolase FlgJ [Sulfuricella sp. T08]GAO36377.1 flagellar rod assembly protein FlgJ [Sulfuricella sp. T08]
MIGTQDISSRFALDVQSVDKLRLQVKQDPDAALKAVAQQFEGIFMNMMLKSMREATPKDGMLDSEQGNLYTQLFDQQLAQKLSTGKGLGVADMLVKQLARSGLVASNPNLEKAAQEKIAQPPMVLEKSKQIDSPKPLQQWTERVESATPAFKNPKEFVDKLWPHAVEAGKELGIPPHFLLGQAALESGWGKRAIRGQDGQDSLNLFGIKAGAKWGGEVVAAATTEYVNGVPQARREGFRAYGSYAESFRDYAALLRNNPRYQGAFGQDIDAAGFARVMQQAGYATDPMYASKLARVVNSETMRQALAG